MWASVGERGRIDRNVEFFDEFSGPGDPSQGRADRLSEVDDWEIPREAVAFAVGPHQNGMMNNFLRTAIAIALFALAGCEPMSPTTGQAPPKVPARVQLLDFGAEWCGPCHQLKPAIKQLQKEFSVVDFTIVDVDKNRDLPAKYEIRELPTVIVLLDGKAVARFIGVEPYEVYARALDDALLKAEQNPKK